MAVTRRQLLLGVLVGSALLLTLWLWPSSSELRDTPLPWQWLRKRLTLRPLHLRSLQRFRNGDGTVFFQHMHKAGGTVFCRVAFENDVRFGKNDNCNPLDASGKLIALNQLSISDQLRAIDRDKKKMIGNEAFLPASRTPLGDRLSYVVELRDPLNRWLSHFYHMVRDKRAKLREGVDRYQDGFDRRNILDNFYVRMLTGVDWEVDVTRQHFERALEVLNEFAIVFPAERLSEAVPLLKQLLGWKVFNIHETSDRVKEGEVRSSNATKELDPIVLEKLKYRERFDIELYDYAVRALYFDLSLGVV